MEAMSDHKLSRIEVSLLHRVCQPLQSVLITPSKEGTPFEGHHVVLLLLDRALHHHILEHLPVDHPQFAVTYG